MVTVLCTIYIEYWFFKLLFMFYVKIKGFSFVSLSIKKYIFTQSMLDVFYGFCNGIAYSGLQLIVSCCIFIMTNFGRFFGMVCCSEASN